MLAVIEPAPPSGTVQNTADSDVAVQLEPDTVNVDVSPGSSVPRSTDGGVTSMVARPATTTTAVSVSVPSLLVTLMATPRAGTPSAGTV